MGVSQDVPRDTDARLASLLKAWIKENLSGSDVLELDQALGSLSRRGSFEHSDVLSGRGSPKGLSLVAVFFVGFSCHASLKSHSLVFYYNQKKIQPPCNQTAKQATLYPWLMLSTLI